MLRFMGVGYWFTGKLGSWFIGVWRLVEGVMHCLNEWVDSSRLSESLVLR